MSTYRVSIDPSLCSGFGACVDLAPALFRLEAGGVASTVEAETSDPAAVEAAAACPMGAIFVSEVQEVVPAA
jgi:ferredoxin